MHEIYYSISKCLVDFSINCHVIISLICRAGSTDDGVVAAADVTPAQPAAPQPTVIPGADSLIGDLLDMDLGPPMVQQQFQPQMPGNQPVQNAAAMDIFGEGLDSLVHRI